MRPISTRRVVTLAPAMLLAIALSGTAGAVPSMPTFSLHPGVASAGESVTIEGHDFAPGETVDIEFGGSTIASATANGSGTFSTFGYIPMFMPVGDHPMDANGNLGGNATMDYTVIPPSGFSCGGMPVGAGKLGTNGNDIIIGTDGNDVLFGRAGDDTMDGLGGKDLMCGGSGNDTMVGAKGADKMWGGDGNDWMYGGNGKDRVTGNAGKDRLFGNTHHDILNGGNGSDRAFGGSGDDLLKGGYGNDLLKGQGDDDELFGQFGDDELRGGFGTDSADGGPDTDFCKAESKIRCNP